MTKEQFLIFNQTGDWLICNCRSVMDDITGNGVTIEKYKQLNEIHVRMNQWKKDFSKLKQEYGDEL
jgi:hypothetical protein